MRVSITVSAIAVLAVGVLLLVFHNLDPSYFQVGIFASVLGCLNLALGIATPISGGVSVRSNSKDPLKMVVDKGVIGATIYLMAFSNRKLVLKRLTSGTVTMFAVIIFAVAGLLIAGYIGAAAGGVTAFTIQEFATQRRRDAAEKGNLLDASARGDLEFSLNELEKIQLTRNRVRLYMKKGILGVVVSRKYPEQMKPVLERIMTVAKISDSA